jgi:hypothetical protein
MHSQLNWDRQAIRLQLGACPTRRSLHVLPMTTTTPLLLHILLPPHPWLAPPLQMMIRSLPPLRNRRPHPPKVRCSFEVSDLSGIGGSLASLARRRK